MRLAFRSCKQQHRRSNLRCFSSSIISRNDPPRKDFPSDPPDRALAPRKQSHAAESNGEHGRKAQDQTGLAPRDPEKRAVGTGRRVPVPLKVIPRAQLSPQIHLSPRQRLHVEMMTRRPTVNTEEKKVYRERIQIYHMGAFKESLLTTLKISSIVAVCAVTFVVAPAHLSGDTALWLTALIWAAGFVPGLVTHYSTKSWVNRVFLDLPPSARESPKTIMEYAKNLPSETLLDIRYIHPWGLEGSVQAATSDLVPTKSRFLRPLTFQWKNKAVMQHRKSSKWEPEAFYVEPKTAFGKKSKDTIPGIWENVYRQIMKDPGKPSLKWKSHLEPWET